jgi:hypothetical protein
MFRVYGIYGGNEAWYIIVPTTVTLTIEDATVSGLFYKPASKFSTYLPRAAEQRAAT